jgi:hypothetical protein
VRAARRSELADFRASVAEADAEAREALQRLREHVAEELAAELERRRSSRELKRAGWPRHAESQNKGLQVIHALYCYVHVLTAQEKGWFPTNAEYIHEKIKISHYNQLRTTQTDFDSRLT